MYVFRYRGKIMLKNNKISTTNLTFVISQLIKAHYEKNDKEFDHLTKLIEWLYETNGNYNSNAARQIREAISTKDKQEVK